MENAPILERREAGRLEVPLGCAFSPYERSSKGSKTCSGSIGQIGF